MQTLQVSQAEASILAKQTKGYSFAFQTIGYFVFENCDNIPKALDDVKDYLYIFAYEKIWSELSAKDKQVAFAVANVPDGEIIKIRENLDIQVINLIHTETVCLKQVFLFARETAF